MPFEKPKTDKQKMDKLKINKEVKQLNSIDESLYSRQLYAIGRDAMTKMTTSSVLITCAENFSGSAIELAKCIILAGVKKVSIHSALDILTYRDLASNYYATEEDIGSGFIDGVVKKLAELNSNVEVNREYYLTQECVKKHDVVVFCDYNVYNLFGWNKFCRGNNVKFIMLQTYGLVFNMFCDFGDNFVTNDHDGEPTRTGIIVETKDSKFRVFENHNLYTGDVIEIDLTINSVKGMKSTKDKYLVEILSGTEFQLHEYKEQYSGMTPEQLQSEVFKSQYLILPDQVLKSVPFKHIKLPVNLKFKSLSDSIVNPSFVMFDTAVWDMPKILNHFMVALGMWRIATQFTVDYETYPTDVWQSFPVNKDDYSLLKMIFVREISTSVASEKSEKLVLTKDVEKIFDLLVRTCAGRICGIDAVAGSLCAQEVIKAVANKFTPTNQFIHFEALNILPDDYLEEREKNEKDYEPENSRYDGQTWIFGKKYVDILRDKKIFIVGAGAIGCEHIKNFSMQGIKNMIITDMDHIENSNLNRQFLFRRDDIGKPKSVTASSKAKLLNPDVNVIAHENKVGKETINIYNTDFFKKVDIVANALDNVEARLFVDTLCVKYSKPLLESGTLGTKGNVQSVVPNLTESYGSLQDPPEQSIAVCTLKLFPYKYEHVVQYARDLFEGYFNRIPSNFIKARDTPDVLSTMTPTDLSTLYEDIKTISHGCKNFKFCINIAYKQWHILFRDVINQLVKKYPKDHKDDDGSLFWSGTKAFPKSFKFENNDQTDLDFVINFSHVWADMIGIPANKRYPIDRRDKYTSFLSRLAVPEEVVCKDVATDSQKKQSDSENKVRKTVKEKPALTPEEMINSINTMIAGKKEYLQNVKPISFEKDDDSNHHIDFVTAFSNKRSSNYQIESKDRLATKGIAGKIIPAIATTTSVVAGLISLELYKLVFGMIDKKYDSLQRYRYGSFNLAVQSFGFSEPNPAKSVNINNKDYTIWTKEMRSPDDTIETLIEEWSDVLVRKKVKGIEQKQFMSLDFIANSDGVIYSNMMDGIDDIRVSKKNNPKYKKLRDFVKKGETGDHYFTISLEDIHDEDEDQDDYEKQMNNQGSETMINLVITC